MATFKEIELADLSTPFNPDEAGEAAVLTPADGAEAEITVVSQNTNWIDENTIGSLSASTRIMKALRSEYAAPQPHDIITLTDSGEVWEVSRILKINSRVVTVECVLNPRMRLK